MQNGSARLDKVVPKANARRETSGPDARGFVATTAAEAGKGPLVRPPRPPLQRLPRSARLALALHIPLIFTSTFASLRPPPPPTPHTPVKAKSEFDPFKAGCPLWEAAARGPLFTPLPLPHAAPQAVLAGGPRAAPGGGLSPAPSAQLRT